MKLSPLLLAAVLGSSTLCQAACQQLDIQPLHALKADFLLLGEMHGTEQSPAFAGELACNLLEDGKGLLLGLEIPRPNRPDWMPTCGRAATRRPARPYWTDLTGIAANGRMAAAAKPC
ncbi:hypothetical protein FNU76_08640 [Chitinimonas arctica]|uniref:ChaN family lipoprotein n=1 Tax=Chitinimonas arctica TaxID=2594795 RepID=A0A516SE31_9NEIS|nr:hypothetical protein [Chitinimonas arctica]QDQ26426.1 hypothetical protein FNU76_08640 [Chitinimonas arctica]